MLATSAWVILKASSIKVFSVTKQTTVDAIMCWNAHFISMDNFF